MNTGADAFVFYKHEDEAGVTLVGENRMHVPIEVEVDASDGKNSLLLPTLFTLNTCVHTLNMHFR